MFGRTSQTRPIGCPFPFDAKEVRRRRSDVHVGPNTSGSHVSAHDNDGAHDNDDAHDYANLGLGGFGKHSLQRAPDEHVLQRLPLWEHRIELRPRGKRLLEDIPQLVIPLHFEGGPQA